MFKLLSVTINKYKSYKNEVAVEIEPDVTVLVGKNDSGKSALLEAIAKSKIAMYRDEYRFQSIHDYPRAERYELEKMDGRFPVLSCEYKVDDKTLAIISKELGEGVFSEKKITRMVNIKNQVEWKNIDTNRHSFLKFLKNKLQLDDESFKIIEKADTVSNILKLKFNKIGIHSQIEKYLSKIILEVMRIDILKSKPMAVTDPKYTSHVDDYNFYIDSINIPENLLGLYIARKFLEPKTPTFCILSDFDMFPNSIKLNSIKHYQNLDPIRSQQIYTIKALLEILSINLNKINELKNNEFVTADLEDASVRISKQLSEYWNSSQNYSIDIGVHHIDPQPGTPADKEISIRVRNQFTHVPLPLINLSKGFQCFFFYMVWFTWINKTKRDDTIILMDEPGLHLHASAQADLLKFIENQSKYYQIIYTTHSPFMINSNALQRVRTVYDSGDGSKISNNLEVRDQKSLFPLQTALGYDISQSLFISSKNLIVEGVSDLFYLTSLSLILKYLGFKYLRSDVTIVPVGGIDNAHTFISLFRASKLNVVCLLDSPNNCQSTDKINNLINENIIEKKKVLFANYFTDSNSKKTDIEDLFSREDYIHLFNSAFPEIDNITTDEFNGCVDNIISLISNKIEKKKYNHCKPAIVLQKIKFQDIRLSDETLKRFEKIFITINRLFE